jgi:hypothetical protein
MNHELKMEVKNKAQYVYGLLNVLKCDIDILRKDASDCNLGKLKESIRDTDATLQKLLLVVEELEYIIKLDKIEGPL